MLRLKTDCQDEREVGEDPMIRQPLFDVNPQSKAQVLLPDLIEEDPWLPFPTGF